MQPLLTRDMSSNMTAGFGVFYGLASRKQAFRTTSTDTGILQNEPSDKPIP